MRTFKQIAIIALMIGVVAIGINMLFGTNTVSFIYRERVEASGLYWYKYDFWGYINNLKNSIADTAQLELSIQTRDWVNITSTIVQEQFWVDLGNNMAVILNWILFGLNVMLYPFRIAAYVIKQLLAFIGINTQSSTNNGLWWLVQLVRFLTGLQIPYV